MIQSFKKIKGKIRQVAAERQQCWILSILLQWVVMHQIPFHLNDY